MKGHSIDYVCLNRRDRVYHQIGFCLTKNKIQLSTVVVNYIEPGLKPRSMKLAKAEGLYSKTKQFIQVLFQIPYHLFTVNKEHDKPIKLWQELNDITVLDKLGTICIAATKISRDPGAREDKLDLQRRESPVPLNY